MRKWISFGAIVLLGATGCGSDSGTGPSASSYEAIGGSYAGAMVGLSQGVALSGTFTITIVQSEGTASGSWGMSVTLNDGTTQLPVNATGTLTGTIASGTNPSVNITVRQPACPNYHATFSGTYDSANRRLTLYGPVEFFGLNSCTVSLSYGMTVTLTR